MVVQLLLRLPLVLGVIVFLVYHSDSFRQYSRHFPKRYVSLHRLADFVRPAAEFNLANVVTVESLLKEYDELAKIEGVYAIQDMDGEIRYVGASMAVAREVSRHLSKHGTTVVNSVRIQTFTNPKPEAMDAYKLELVRQTSAKGNLEDSAEWEDKAVIRSIGTEKVVAVVDPILSSSGSSSSSKASVMSRLIEVVDVDGDRKAAASAAVQTGSVIESPFASSSSSSSSSNRANQSVPPGDINAPPLDLNDPNAYVVGPSGSSGLELTKENVDKVLDEIRPYLIADGGNVAVVSIDEFTRSISLTLQGACGSCPSSTTTMKMGVERVLKENFSNLGPVLSVDPAVAVSSLTIDAVEKALEKVLGAIKGLGGSVEISSVDATSGHVQLRYKGPARLTKGIELVLKDLKDVKSVLIDTVV